MPRSVWFLESALSSLVSRQRNIASRRKSRHKSRRMVQMALSTGATAAPSSARNKNIKAFQWILLARFLDDKLPSLYRGGKIHGGVFLGRGQEALSVSVDQNLPKGDGFPPPLPDAAG